jgi:hypothetical protein
MTPPPASRYRPPARDASTERRHPRVIRLQWICWSEVAASEPAVRRPAGRAADSSFTSTPPRHGAERLQNWAAFRLRLLRSDDAVSAHQISAAQGVKFRGGTGSCLIDGYVIRIGGHHYDEIACLVQGQTSASVIIAAAPATPPGHHAE